MEQLPADARAAPSASEPNDTVMDIHASPKRPRETAQGNMVSQRATSIASVMPESQSVTTVLLPRAPARACQSLAHHTTPMGRCRKSVDNWAPLCEEPQSRSTTTQSAERLRKTDSSAILAAVYHCRPLQTTLSRKSRDPDTTNSKVQTPSSTTTVQPSGAESTAPQPAHDSPRERWVGVG
eukprot:scaffold7832_cov106-Isochrysis_galbana.AAC.1